jgi:hypothetical protein
MSGSKEYAAALSKVEKDIRISEQQEAENDYNTHLYGEIRGSHRLGLPEDSSRTFMDCP